MSALLVAGLSHHSAPVEVRERFAFPEHTLPDALRELRALGLLQEAVILSTCNRVEIYGAAEGDAAEILKGLETFLITNRALTDLPGSCVYKYAEPKSLEHLFKVACGLDSMILGETEILGQVKKAYGFSLERGFTGKYLNKLFQRAFQASKHVRASTGIQRGSVSVGSVAVELAEKIFSSLHDRDVMVLGAGETSERTARALLSRGARSIIVSNRNYDRAASLAAQLGGRAADFSHWEEEFHSVDIIISSTSAPHYVLDRAKIGTLLSRRKNRPLLLIDIAVPRDIDPEVHGIDNVYLYNIDDLQGIASNYLKQRAHEVSRCEAIIAESIKGLLALSRTCGA